MNKYIPEKRRKRNYEGHMKGKNMLIEVKRRDTLKEIDKVHISLHRRMIHTYRGSNFNTRY